MPKLTYNDKSNANPVINRDTQATAADFNDIKASVNAVYDGTAENFYAFRGATEFVAGTLFYSIVNSRNESSVEFYAPTITSDTGTFNLGGATAISNSGENITFSSFVTGERYNPAWVKQGQNEDAFARLTLEAPVTINYETSKADILINPEWTVTIGPTPGSHRTIEYRLESDTTITNCKFIAERSGIEFFTADFGTLVANVERVVDMTIDPNVPPDVFEGDVYDLKVESPDGAVRLKGSIANSAPYFVANVLPFVDYKVITANDVIDEDDMVSNLDTKVPTQQSVKKYVDTNDDIDQIKASLTTNLILDGTEQHIQFDNSYDTQGLTMPSNGVFEVGRDGYYTGALHIYMANSGLPSIVVWVECRDDGLSLWELCGQLMTKTQAFTDSSTTIPFDSNFNFTGGQQFRIKIKKLSGTSTLTNQTETVTLGTLTQYPASVTIFRVGNKRIV